MAALVIIINETTITAALKVRVGGQRAFSFLFYGPCFMHGKFPSVSQGEASLETPKAPVPVSQAGHFKEPMGSWDASGCTGGRTCRGREKDEPR